MIRSTRPLAGASVTLKAVTSDYSLTTQSDNNGEFSFSTVPVGDYKITVSEPNFANEEQSVTVESNSSTVLHFQLTIAPVKEAPWCSAERSRPT